MPRPTRQIKNVLAISKSLRKILSFLLFSFRNCWSSSPSSVYQRLIFVQCLLFKKKLSFARCTSAAIVVYRDVDIFGTKTLSLNHIFTGAFLIIWNIVPNMNICIFFSRRIKAGMIALTEFLLLSKWYKLPCFVFPLCVSVCFVIFFCSHLLYNWPMNCWVST
jgi:hypothetical protein